MKRILKAATGAALLLLAQAAIAQDPRKAVLGEFVRVTTAGPESRPLVAPLWAARSDEIVLRPARPQDSPLVIPMFRVRRIEVRRPTAETRAGAGALIGTVVGLISMGAAGYYSTRCGASCGGDYGKGYGVVAAIPGSGMGALAGVIIGKRIKVHRWSTLVLPLQLDDSVAGFRRGITQTRPGRQNED